MAQHSRLDNFIVLRGLGQGATAKVKAVQDPNTGNIYAAKILRSQGETLTTRFREVVQNEMQSLNRIHHPNIVNLINANENGVYLKKDGRMLNCMYMIIELCPNGELFDILFQTGRFDERTSRFYFHQLIAGLEACHQSGITHRDLKPENILFDENFSLKITDFGFAILISGRDGSGNLNTHLGTEGYMAPEIHARRPYSGEAVDIFAAGIILFIMYSQNPPFTKAITTDPYYKLISNREDKFWQLHSRNKPVNYYSDEFKSLITEMLALDPAQRLTISQIKAHPWFNGPIATAEEVGNDLRLRRQQAIDAAEKARQQRLRATNNRTGIVYQNGRLYRGEETDIGDLSLSFSIPHEDLTTRPLPSHYGAVKKYCDIKTGLCPQELMTIVSISLSDYSVECETSNERYEMTANVITETDVVNFKVRIYDAEDGYTVLSFGLNKGSKYEMMNIYKKVEERIQEVQNS